MTYEWDDFERETAAFLVRRYREQGIWIKPRVPTGNFNLLSDVDGVQVGHVTLDGGEIQTGCTAIDFGAIPLERELACGYAVLNGFGKPAGLVQIHELGLLSGPIMLGNTYSIGSLFDASVRWASSVDPRLGRELPTFNPVVLECNDSFLNNLQSQKITADHGIKAIETVTSNFPRGSVGAGRGMSCFGMKGGIGSASRKAKSSMGNFSVGALVLANFGDPKDFTLSGIGLGGWLSHHLQAQAEFSKEKGSIIVVLATDAPLDARRLNRLAHRAGVGIGRTGAFWGNGSGDICIAVSTNTTCSEYVLDDDIDDLFRAAADATEGAIVDALLQAEPVVGFEGHHRRTLTQILSDLGRELGSSIEEPMIVDPKCFRD